MPAYRGDAKQRTNLKIRQGLKTVTRATASNIRDTIKTIWKAKPKPWEIWPEGRPSGTPEDYCKALTGHSWEWLIATAIMMGQPWWKGPESNRHRRG